MKRVLLDCDGVLSDFIGPVLDLVWEATGRTYTREDVKVFDFAASLGLEPEENAVVKDEISHRRGWWSELPIMPGAQEGVARLQQIADVYIVTSPWNNCRTWLYERETWLRKHFGIPHSRVLACSAKHIVAGDVLVDDRIDTLLQWQDHNPRGAAVQWQTPHNRNDGWRAWSTKSWDQLVGWVQ